MAAGIPTAPRINPPVQDFQTSTGKHKRRVTHGPHKRRGEEPSGNPSVPRAHWPKAIHAHLRSFAAPRLPIHSRLQAATRDPLAAGRTRNPTKKAQAVADLRLKSVILVLDTARQRHRPFPALRGRPRKIRLGRPVGHAPRHQRKRRRQESRARRAARHLRRTPHRPSPPAPAASR